VARRSGQRLGDAGLLGEIGGHIGRGIVDRVVNRVRQASNTFLDLFRRSPGLASKVDRAVGGVRPLKIPAAERKE